MAIKTGHIGNIAAQFLQQLLQQHNFDIVYHANLKCIQQ